MEYKQAPPEAHPGAYSRSGTGSLDDVVIVCSLRTPLTKVAVYNTFILIKKLPPIPIHTYTHIHIHPYTYIHHMQSKKKICTI